MGNSKGEALPKGKLENILQKKVQESAQVTVTLGALYSVSSSETPWRLHYTG